MNLLFKISSYQLRDVIRSKWIFFYTILLMIISYSLISLTKEPAKILITMLNINLIIVPLISLIFGTIFLYNNKNNIIFLLSQPIKRNVLFLGLYIGLILPIILGFLLGVGIPILFYVKIFSNYAETIFLLLTTGIVLTIIFGGVAFYISISNEDRMKGLGISIIVWLFLSIFYDGLLLIIFQTFADYPLEKISAFLIMFNPIDLTRILVVINFDVSALMGYTGTVFKNFFGGNLGVLISALMLMFWSILPLYLGLRKFKAKDF
ncbi:MAG: ABC transporter permease [Ignavibacteriae bacterium HGW-Ignavibacteriae-2]|nr:ABC transporter permease subunit [Bacteroidota bacterium]PKL88864.1 MAG: ABC transporter permease [Ignavibacteriae bacterium HGW-Ignavibacteriae-2]